ncbi:hypothetical protein DUNSADRAFT_16475 [Dunaliella salina]|uniref:Rab-GAP TBC domain-containing protein n=1 Tax=Dunaliella salina TaxID=3046 RepID=A0ABQ7H103_DUNSA|nr:hypothetical protein DUNSADRAFT_16475 [Dunaliella salina]|eukprot:KAF5840534.1 hypothetical protein DUNSADRAFT_16475 [Dunaliella salina]
MHACMHALTHTQDLTQLRKLAAVRGLVNSSLRARCWPLLCGPPSLLPRQPVPKSAHDPSEVSSGSSSAPSSSRTSTAGQGIPSSTQPSPSKSSTAHASHSKQQQQQQCQHEHLGSKHAAGGGERRREWRGAWAERVARRSGTGSTSHAVDAEWQRFEVLANTRHRDSQVVAVDVDRSLWAFMKGASEAELLAKRAQLQRLINAAVSAHATTTSTSNTNNSSSCPSPAAAPQPASASPPPNPSPAPSQTVNSTSVAASTPSSLAADPPSATVSPPATASTTSPAAPARVAGTAQTIEMQHSSSSAPTKPHTTTAAAAPHTTVFSAPTGAERSADCAHSHANCPSVLAPTCTSPPATNTPPPASSGAAASSACPLAFPGTSSDATSRSCQVSHSTPGVHAPSNPASACCLSPAQTKVATTTTTTTTTTTNTNSSYDNNSGSTDGSNSKALMAGPGGVRACQLVALHRNGHASKGGFEAPRESTLSCVASTTTEGVPVSTATAAGKVSPSPSLSSPPHPSWSSPAKDQRPRDTSEPPTHASSKAPSPSPAAGGRAVDPETARHAAAAANCSAQQHTASAAANSASTAPNFARRGWFGEGVQPQGNSEIPVPEEERPCLTFGSQDPYQRSNVESKSAAQEATPQPLVVCPLSGTPRLPTSPEAATTQPALPHLSSGMKPEAMTPQQQPAHEASALSSAAEMPSVSSGTTSTSLLDNNSNTHQENRGIRGNDPPLTSLPTLTPTAAIPATKSTDVRHPSFPHPPSAPPMPSDLTAPLLPPTSSQSNPPPVNDATFNSLDVGATFCPDHGNSGAVLSPTTTDAASARSDSFARSSVSFKSATEGCSTSEPPPSAGRTFSTASILGITRASSSFSTALASTSHHGTSPALSPAPTDTPTATGAALPESAHSAALPSMPPGPSPPPTDGPAAPATAANPQTAADPGCARNSPNPSVLNEGVSCAMSPTPPHDTTSGVAATPECGASALASSSFVSARSEPHSDGVLPVCAPCESLSRGAHHSSKSHRDGQPRSALDNPHSPQGPHNTSDSDAHNAHLTLCQTACPASDAHIQPHSSLTTASPTADVACTKSHPQVSHNPSFSSQSLAQGGAALAAVPIGSTCSASESSAAASEGHSGEGPTDSTQNMQDKHPFAQQQQQQQQQQQRQWEPQSPPPEPQQLQQQQMRPEGLQSPPPQLQQQEERQPQQLQQLQQQQQQEQHMPSEELQSPAPEPQQLQQQEEGQPQDQQQPSADHQEVFYYQGLHDVASVLLLVMGSERAAFPLLCRLIGPMGPLRDATRPDLLPVLEVLGILYPIMDVADPQIAQQLREAGLPPFFALSWFITWFSHNVTELKDAARLFDLFLSSHPLMPLYLGAVAMCAVREELLACEDMPMMHSMLNNLRLPQLTLPHTLKVGSRVYSTNWDCQGGIHTASADGKTTLAPSLRSADSSSPSVKTARQEEDGSKSHHSHMRHSSSISSESSGGSMTTHRGGSRSAGPTTGSALDLLIQAALQLLKDAPPLVLIKRTRTPLLVSVAPAAQLHPQLNCWTTPLHPPQAQHAAKQPPLSRLLSVLGLGGHARGSGRGVLLLFRVVRECGIGTRCCSVWQCVMMQVWVRRFPQVRHACLPGCDGLVVPCAPGYRHADGVRGM